MMTLKRVRTSFFTSLILLLVSLYCIALFAKSWPVRSGSGRHHATLLTGTSWAEDGSKVHSLNLIQSPSLLVFWREYVAALEKARPTSKQIKCNGSASREDEQNISPTRARLDITSIDDDDLAELKSSHKAMVKSVRNLEASLPYRPGTRGIAMTAGGRYFGVAVTSVRMLRRSGSRLPVELFLDSSDDYDATICDKILASMNAKCLVMQHLWNQTPAFAKLDKYQFKAFALLFSSFEHILFLDADAFSVHNPDILLDVEPYKGSGLVTWPDFWESTTSHYFYEIADIPIPPLDIRKSSESGIMIYNKRMHAASLLLAAYYNYYGPKYYYPLFSQGNQGEGDKESFLHAALALDLPFYDIQTPTMVIGTFLNGTWETAGMKQADPVQDWTLSQANILNRLRKNPKDENQDGKEDEVDGNEQNHATAKPFFIHNNLVKIDIKHIFESIDRWRNETGHLVRIWGHPEDLVRQFGYDVEQVLWEEVTKASCQFDLGLCERVKQHFAMIYGHLPTAYADGLLQNDASAYS